MPKNYKVVSKLPEVTEDSFANETVIKVHDSRSWLG